MPRKAFKMSEPSNAAMVADSLTENDENQLVRAIQQFVCEDYERFVHTQAHRSDELWFPFVLGKLIAHCATVNELAAMRGIPEVALTKWRWPDDGRGWDDDDVPF